ncbi:U4/U6.U5 tri-snRNP-associated protein 1 [Papilio xuthus]|uniref:U4/U6.U5 tri-snRNP-associated protein 1 n=1 Tax=Papilio xuthus TaxID=66420 RepID=A0A194Q9W5_PAPXU|nr:U4/U6.U5 tri-snRNP-associated protein 1 [Papilio xuthus]
MNKNAHIEFDQVKTVEEVPVDSHLQPAEDVSSSHSRSRSSSVHRHSSREHEKEQSPAPGGAAQESLSIEETNRLRAKLGLKPLEVTEQTTDDGKIKDDLGEFYHKPADNIAHQKKAEKLREKLEVRREKRKLEQKLQTTLLADESDDEDAIAWVKKSREIEEQKKAAEKRAALLDEMDAVFGVSALVQEEQEAERRQRYSQAHLKGLRVAHDIDALGEEREVVLTLADAPVLAEDAEDVLVNVNMVDDERYKKNIVERKKAAAGYQAYDEEAEVAAALGLARPLLAKYDDEIDKDKSDKKKGFRIGDDDSIEANNADYPLTLLSFSLH